MVKLIVGTMGNGKTKTLIDLVNSAAKDDIGSVVCLEKGTKLTYDISHDVRLVDVSEYGINNYSSLFSFICGLFFFQPENGIEVGIRDWNLDLVSFGPSF